MNEIPSEPGPTATPGRPIKTFSLAEVAAMVLPPEWVDSERWLARRLNRGQIRGYRVGRVWRMTEAQVDDLIERFTNSAKLPQIDVPAAAPVPAASIIDGLSSRGRYRVRKQT